MNGGTCTETGNAFPFPSYVGSTSKVSQQDSLAFTEESWNNEVVGVF